MLSNKQLFQGALIFSMALLTISCSSEESAKTKEIETVRPVKLLNIGSMKNSSMLSYPAVIQAGRSSNLAFQVSGKVTSISVSESQEVNKGDILAKLDARDYQAQLNVAQAEFDKSESEFTRSKGLYEKNIISRIEFEALKAQRDINKARLDTAIKSVDDTVLVAPYAGNISKVNLKSNQIIQQGEAVISLLALNTLEAKINLPSSIIAKAKESSYKTPVYVVLNAAPEQKISAFVKEVSLEANPESQTYQVTFYFPAQDGLNILPGMNARVFFSDPSKTNTEEAISVPMTALAQQENNLFVWVVDESNMTVSKRLVTIEDGIGEELLIKSGLSKNETIVTSGVPYLSEGMKVRAWVKD